MLILLVAHRSEVPWSVELCEETIGMDEVILGIVFCGSLVAALALQKAALELLLRAMCPRTIRGKHGSYVSQ
jgi:hypothetical protein